MSRAAGPRRFRQAARPGEFRRRRPVLSVGITTMREHLPAVIELVGRLLREPAFPADALDERRRQALAAIEQPAQASPVRWRPTRCSAMATRTRAATCATRAPSTRGRRTCRRVTPERVRALHRRFVSAAKANSARSATSTRPRCAARSRPPSATGPHRRRRPSCASPQPWWRRRRCASAGHARQAQRQPGAAPAGAAHRHRCRLPGAAAGQPPARWLCQLAAVDAHPRDRRPELRRALGFSWNTFEPHSRWQATAIFAPQNQPRVEAALKEEVARALKDGFTQAELDEGRRAC